MVYQQLAEQYLSLQQQQRALLQHQHQLQTLLDDKTQQLQQLMDTSVSFYRDVHMGPFSQHPMPNTLLSRNAPPPMPTCNTLPPQSLTSNTFSPKPLTSLIRSMRDIAANHDALLQSSRERQQHMGDMDDVALVQQAMHALEEMWRTLTTVHGAPGCASSAFVKERLPPVAVRQQCIEQCVEEHVCSTSHADDHTYHHGHHAVGALLGYHAFTPQQVKTLMAIRMSFVTTWQCLLKERRVLVTDMQHAVQCRGKDMGVEVMHFLQHVHEHVFLNHPLAGVQLLCKAWPHVPDGLSLCTAIGLLHKHLTTHTMQRAVPLLSVGFPMIPAPPADSVSKAFRCNSLSTTRSWSPSSTVIVTDEVL